eukprot:8412510-Alexandrium_andersonii.AAC.1
MRGRTWALPDVVHLRLDMVLPERATFLVVGVHRMVGSTGKQWESLRGDGKQWEHPPHDSVAVSMA